MIVIESISLQRGGRPLLENTSLTIHDGQHIGITGANGTGKTSLFKLLLGELGPDNGNIHMPPRLSIAHMAQETEFRDITATEHVIDGDKHLRRLEQELIIAEREQRHDAVAHIHAALQHIDGYNAHYRAEQLLHGLGFTQQDCNRRVHEFSGGWRIRLNLAQVLMSPGDLLLLDEPTNHLDLDATIWLEQWLQRFQGTLLLISHDRDFLDSVTDSIVHVEHLKLNLYKGNYSAFERQRAERLAQQQALFEKQQLRIREIESFVTRFRAKASKARQAQSRLKELDRMQMISSAHIDSPFNFRIPESPKLSDPLLVLNDAAIGYGEKVLLKNVKLNLHPGSRIGLLGANGAGKSTLIKTLLGELSLVNGERVQGEHLRIGYFAQHQLEALDLDASPALHLQRLTPTATEQSIRNYLGGFNFHGDSALAPVRPFSGGEKARLALAIVAWQRPNLLLMDEPTNHLDLDMRHALTMALQEFNGAMIIVSHDRHLLRNCVDEFWLVADGRVSTYDGDLEDYQKLLTRKDTAPITEDNITKAANNPKEQRRLAAARRQQLSPIKNRLQKIEQQMDKLRTELASIEGQLADPQIYQDNNRTTLQKVLQQQLSYKKELGETEEQWLELQEQLEALEQEIG
jgi:ATP-binding cassette subfamily F protein 3